LTATALLGVGTPNVNTPEALPTATAAVRTLLVSDELAAPSLQLSALLEDHAVDSPRLLPERAVMLQSAAT
jgi:hypothetical protein